MSKRILVADDDVAILEAIKIILEDEGYSVETTADGGYILSLQQDLPDLLLLDIWLSGVDGGEIVTQLRQRELTKNLPVIMVSANRDTEQISYQVGANGFVLKPFDIDDLVATIQGVLR